MNKKIKISKAVISLFIILLIISTTFEFCIQLASSEETPEQQTQDAEKLILDDQYSDKYFSVRENLHKDQLSVSQGESHLRKKYNSAFSVSRDKNVIYSGEKGLLTNGKIMVFLGNFSQDSLFFYEDRSIQLNGNKVNGVGQIYKINNSKENIFVFKNNFKNLDYMTVVFQDLNSSLNFTEKEIILKGKAKIDLFFKDNKRIFIETNEYFKIDSNYNINSRESHLLFYPFYQDVKSIFCFQALHEVQGNFNITFKDSNLASIKSIGLSQSKLFNKKEYYQNFEAQIILHLQNQSQSIFFTAEDKKSGLFILPGKVVASGKFSIDYSPYNLSINSEKQGKLTIFQKKITTEGRVDLENDDFHFTPLSERTKFIFDKVQDQNNIFLDLSNSKANFIVKAELPTDSSFEDEIDLISPEYMDGFSGYFLIPIEIFGNGQYNSYIDEKIIGRLSELYNQGMPAYTKKFKLSFGENTILIDSKTNWFLNFSKKSNPESDTVNGNTIIGLVTEAITTTDETPSYKVASQEQISSDFGILDGELHINEDQKQKVEIFSVLLQQARWANAANTLAQLKSDSTDPISQKIYLRIKEDDPILVSNLESQQFSSSFFKNMESSISNLEKSKEAKAEYERIQKQFEAKNLKYSVSVFEVGDCQTNNLLINRFEIISGEYNSNELTSLIGISPYELYSFNRKHFGDDIIFDFDLNDIIDKKTNSPVVFKEGFYFMTPDTQTTLGAKEQFVEYLRTQIYSSRYYKIAYFGVKNITVSEENERQRIESLNKQVENDRKLFSFTSFIKQNQIDKKIHDGQDDSAYLLLSKYPDEDLVASYIKQKISEKELEFSQKDLYVSLGDNNLYSRNPLIQELITIDPSTKENMESNYINGVRAQLGFNENEMTYSETMQIIAAQSSLKEYTERFNLINKGIADKTILPTSAIEEEIAILNQGIADSAREMDKTWFTVYQRNYKDKIGKYDPSKGYYIFEEITSPFTNKEYSMLKTFEQNNFDKEIREISGIVTFIASVGIVVVVGIISGGIGSIVAAQLLVWGATSSILIGTCTLLTTSLSFVLLMDAWEANQASIEEGGDFLFNFEEKLGWNPEEGEYGRNFAIDFAFTTLMFAALGGTNKVFQKLKLNPSITTRAVQFTSEIAVFDVIGLGQGYTEIQLNPALSQDEKMKQIRAMFSPESLSKMTIKNVEFLIGLKVAHSAINTLTTAVNERSKATSQAKLEELDRVNAELLEYASQLRNDPSKIELAKKVLELNERSRALQTELGYDVRIDVDFADPLTSTTLTTIQGIINKYSVKLDPLNEGKAVFTYNPSKGTPTLDEVYSLFKFSERFGELSVVSLENKFTLIRSYDKQVVAVLVPEGTRDFAGFSLASETYALARSSGPIGQTLTPKSIESIFGSEGAKVLSKEKAIAELGGNPLEILTNPKGRMVSNTLVIGGKRYRAKPFQTGDVTEFQNELFARNFIIGLQDKGLLSKDVLTPRAIGYYDAEAGRYMLVMEEVQVKKGLFVKEFNGYSDDMTLNERATLMLVRESLCIGDMNPMGILTSRNGQTFLVDFQVLGSRIGMSSVEFARGTEISSNTQRIFRLVPYINKNSYNNANDFLPYIREFQRNKAQILEVVEQAARSSEIPESEISRLKQTIGKSIDEMPQALDITFEKANSAFGLSRNVVRSSKTPETITSQYAFGREFARDFLSRYSGRYQWISETAGDLLLTLAGKKPVFLGAMRQLPLNSEMIDSIYQSGLKVMTFKDGNSYLIYNSQLVKRVIDSDPSFYYSKGNTQTEILESIFYKDAAIYGHTYFGGELLGYESRTIEGTEYSGNLFVDGKNAHGFRIQDLAKGRQVLLDSAKELANIINKEVTVNLYNKDTPEKPSQLLESIVVKPGETPETKSPKGEWITSGDREVFLTTEKRAFPLGFNSEAAWQEYRGFVGEKIRTLQQKLGIKTPLQVKIYGSAATGVSCKTGQFIEKPHDIDILIINSELFNIISMRASSLAGEGRLLQGRTVSDQLDYSCHFSSRGIALISHHSSVLPELPPGNLGNARLLEKGVRVSLMVAKEGTPEFQNRYAIPITN